MRNKYLLILFLVTSFFGYGQYNYVEVDDTYTPERLIKEVLVNAGCDLVSNVRYQYGSGALGSEQVKAAGYFNRNGSSFPFDEGIVLGTDVVSDLEGPSPGGSARVTSPNQYRWTGDQDLLDLINDAGGWPTRPVTPTDMRSTVIDFEFIPVQPTVNFEYLFGSHSYYRGCNFDCGNGAMFGAWLIDLTTGVGENLAKVPGTNQPISISTVRDNDKTNPSNCDPGVGSVNPQFFGNAYGTGVNQLPLASSPISLPGQTVAMTSMTANVVVGRRYRIKLAVIDFCPNRSHTSAVFFKAGSFDIGNLDLGTPVLIADDNGLCVGDSHTLRSGLDPLLFAFEWYKDGVVIPGATGPNLVVTETGDYKVVGFIPTIPDCFMESDPVRVEFYDYVNILQPSNLELCPNAGASTRFDLIDAVANVTTNPNMLFKFYTSQQNALDDVNAIPDVYMLANNAAVPVTIWVRAYEEGNPCPDVESFTLNFLNCNLALNPLPDLTICEGDPVQTFDLTVQTPLVYNNAVGYSVTYHLSSADANTNQNAIPAGNLATYNGSHGDRIWVRVTNDNNPLAYGVGSFFLYRYQLPLTKTTILPITACEIGATGTATFDLNLAYTTVPVAAVDVSLEFYSSQQDAVLGNTAVALPVNYTGSAGTIYVRVRNLNGDCFKIVPLQLQIVNTPVANQIAPLTYCDLNNDGFGQFNLDATRVLIAGNPLPANAIVTFHETQNDANANVNRIFNTGTYVNKVKDQQTIYVRVGFTNSTCYNTVTLQLIVNKTPAITPIGFIEVCDINNDFVEVVNLRSKESVLLTGLNAANFTVTYHTNAQNALSGTGVIANPTAFSTSVAREVWVRVVDNTTGCFVTSKIELRLIEMPVVANPLPTYSVCDKDANGFEVFDLASKKNSIVGVSQGLDVTFHYTNADAQAGINPLPNQYQNVSPNVQTIYVRVSNGSSGCFVITTMKLEVLAAPVVNVPTTPFVICSDSGFGTINLFLYGKDLLDAMNENYTFKFYETQANAIDDVNSINNVVAYNNLNPNNPVVWIRYEDPDTDCFTVYPIHFELVTPPRLPVSLPKLVECDVLGNTQDQSTLFDLTVQEAAMLAVQNSPGTYQLRYFTSLAAAQNNTNWIVDPTQFQNTVNPQEIWIRIENTDKAGNCNRIISFQIEVVSPLVLQQPAIIELCDTALPNDGSMEIDLTVREYDLFGGQPPFGAVITYYRTLADAQNGWNNIGNPKQFYNNTNPQTIYIAVENQYGCRSITTLTVRVLPLPEPNMNPTPLELCEDADLRDQGIFGQAFFDLTSAESDLSNYSDYVYEYYVSESGANNKDTGTRINDPEQFFSGSSKVWVRVENRFQTTDRSCYVVVELELIVNEWPIVGPMTPLTACMDQPTPTTKFNLHDKDAEAVAGNKEKDNLIVKYYGFEEDAFNDVNPLPYTFENTTQTRQTIWVRVENTETGCFDIASLLLQIEEAVYAFKPQDTEFCETDYVNDGHSLVDLTVLSSEIIGGQPLAADLLVRYERWDGTPINNPLNVQVYNGEVIRAVVYNDDPNLYCTATVEFTVRFKDAPEVKPLVDGIICFEYRDSSQLINGHYLDTGIPTDVNYTFDWTRNGVAVTTNDADILEDGRRIYVKRPGTYQVVVTGTNGCTTTRSAEVVQASAITIDEIKLTDSFGDTNAIEVIAYAGPGVLLEYKLDNGSWQDSNIFLDVTPGEHTVYVRTKDGLSCEASKVVTIMDYPKYFTPNNDGYNDTWNIWSLKNQPDAKIYIFDRFGKLIKQLSPAGAGWDGTFNGKPLPSTDYWFKAEYVDPKTGLNKEVTGHFSLKR